MESSFYHYHFYKFFEVTFPKRLIVLVEGKMWRDQNEICPENKNWSPKKHKNIISFTLHFRANLFWSPHIFPLYSSFPDKFILVPSHFPVNKYYHYLWQPIKRKLFLSPANEVWGKVIFSEACVKNSVHREGSASVHAGIPPRTSQAPPGTRQAPPPGPGRHAPPRTEHAGRYGQRAGGMHPIGM